MAKQYVGHHYKWPSKIESREATCGPAWDFVSSVIGHDGSTQPAPYVDGWKTKLLKDKQDRQIRVACWPKGQKDNTTVLTLFQNERQNRTHAIRVVQGDESWLYDPAQPAPRFVREAFVTLTLGSLLTEQNLQK